MIDNKLKKEYKVQMEQIKKAKELEILDMRVEVALARAAVLILTGNDMKMAEAKANETQEAIRGREDELAFIIKKLETVDSIDDQKGDK